MQDAHANGQLEASRAGATGVEVEHAIALFLQRLVGMPGDHHVDAGGLGIDGQLLEIVQYIKACLLYTSRCV